MSASATTTSPTTSLGFPAGSGRRLLTHSKTSLAVLYNAVLLAWLVAILLGAIVSCGNPANGHQESDTAPDAREDATFALDQNADPEVPQADGGSDAAGPDLTEQLFDPDHLLEIEVTVDPDTWDALRRENPFPPEYMRGVDCEGNPVDRYDWYEAEVTIDGVALERVGIRKKGSFGSLDEDKPSLKLRFDRHVDGQTFSGVDRMTLNNAKQDPGLIRQCLGYQLFADAGVPSPRCNFAHVTVNEVDLGIFVHVEDIKSPFIQRHFNDATGNIYEGVDSDFREGYTITFERKNGEQSVDHPDITALTRALNVPDDELLDELESLIDIDAFLTFWAMEVLINHVDGYAGNINNFFLYRDASDGRFHFIPWGIDIILLDTGMEPVLTNGILASRLYDLPSVRRRYLAELRRLVADVWDVDELQAEVDRMRDLIEPFATEGPLHDEEFDDHVDFMRDVVTHRGAEVLRILDDGAPPGGPPGGGLACP